MLASARERMVGEESVVLRSVGGSANPLESCLDCSSLAKLLVQEKGLSKARYAVFFTLHLKNVTAVGKGYRHRAYIRHSPW